MKDKGKFNWVPFVLGALLGALIGFSLWMSLPLTWSYSAGAGVACVAGMALLVGWFAQR